MIRPREFEYASHVSYTRALEEYCTSLERRQPLTDEQSFQAELFKLAVKKGLLSIHTELVAAPQTDPTTKVSWMEGHRKVCDISNEAAYGIGDKT